MWFSDWKAWANKLKQNTYALYLATKDPRVPLGAKIIIGVVVAYALSPIDLIPDFIPILGYLDDLLLLPLGIWLAVRLIPQPVWQECQNAAAKALTSLPRNRKAAVVIIFVWFVALGLLVLWIVALLR